MKHSGVALVVTCFFSLFSFCTTTGQAINFSREIRFIQYLIDREQYSEADFLLSRFNTQSLQTAQIDTIHYLRGWSAYTNKRLDTAVANLSAVSPAFPLYLKSHLFAAYSAVFLQKKDTAQRLINEISVVDSVTREMKSFQLSGIALLNRDYESYQSLRKDFTHSLFALQKEEQRFDLYRDQMKAFKRHSPFLAGVYSAIIPGAGKFYAGKKKQGIAAFLPILSLGVVTYESYRKSGIKSARTIAFGSLFSVFYIGNIWGSVVSVKIKEQEFYRGYDNKILFDMHIPLRNLYN